MFLFNWNIKLDVIYSVRRATWLMTHSRLKLTWIDSSLNPVWKLIPFERALNCMQYMWIWQHFYIQHRRKLCFYIANCLIRRNSWWIWWYVHVGVQFDCLFESKAESTAECLNVGRTSQWYILMALRIFQYAQKPK